MRSPEAILDAYFQKVAALAASNAIETFTGAKKPSPPSKPKGAMTGGPNPQSGQGTLQNERGVSLNPNVEGTLTQQSLGSGAEKLETGSTLPVTT